MKKKFKETKIGSFLSNKAPNILNAIGDVLPDDGAFGVVKNLISSDNSLGPEDKEMAMKLLEQDIAEMKEVSSRWRSDMKSDSWLSKNTRPMTLIYLTRVSAGQVSPQQIIELEKAIEQSSVDLRNIVDPHTHFALGISLGRYGNVYNLLANNIRLRLNYTANALSQTIHNYVYHSRVLNISKNGQKIMQ